MGADRATLVQTIPRGSTGACCLRILLNPTILAKLAFRLLAAGNFSSCPLCMTSCLPALASLNPAQRQAATHVEGPLLVLAGPGSGKTRVVTHRVAHLIAQGVPANRIVALTFTNKAAEEMRRRVADLVGPQPIEMGTFHRFAARLLRTHARLVGLSSEYSILDTDDSQATLKRAAKKLGLSLTHTPIGRLAGTISRAKNDLVTPETFEPRWGRPVDEIVAKVWPVYQQLLLETNSVDFDDLLVHVARLLLDHPDLRQQLDARFRWILVDEYQDTNAVQYCILHGLSIDYANLAVTGDPDQAIYGWRGASIRNILEFERDYPSATVVALEHNYRSTANILGTADRLIAHNARRKPKRLLTDASPGDPVRIVLDGTSHEEAERIADEIMAAVMAGHRQPRDYCILFRTNALSRAFEVALRSRHLPYQLIRGLEFFKRREVRDIVAWLRLLKNPRDDEALLRIVNVPPRGIGKQSLDRTGAWAEERKLPLLDAAKYAIDIPGVSGRAGKSLTEFARLIDDLSQRAAADPRRVAPLVEAVLDRSGYRAMLAAEAAADEGGEDRLANVEELLTAARQLDEASGQIGDDDDTDALGKFLETTALVSDTDAWDAGGNAVALMTFHAVKGLEFPVVYLVALEDGILPHERSIDHADQLEEERRLVFVGITRGREEVHASAARIRDYRGGRRISAPSVFLTEMQGSETLVCGSEAPATATLTAVSWDETDQTDPFADTPDHVFGAAPKDFRPEETRNRPSAPAGIVRADGLILEPDPEVASGPCSVPVDHGSPSPRGRQPPAVRRAIELTSGGASPPRFRPGQQVQHEEYGLGVIVAMSGSGPRAVATVDFGEPAGIRKFILGHGGLEASGG
jgi:DNA helicase-2/ATP-dependent DNA helicase PcrA